MGCISSETPPKYLNSPVQPSSSGFITAQSGLPINFIANGNNLHAPGNTQRPNVNGTPNVPGNIGPGNLWFDTSMFSSAAPDTWGTASRNGVLDGPTYKNLDMTLAKLLSFGRIKGEVRADIFNVLTTPHFDRPSGNLDSPNFGQITQTVGTVVQNALATTAGSYRPSCDR